MFAFFKSYSTLIKIGVIIAGIGAIAYLGYNYATTMAENERLVHANTELVRQMERLDQQIEYEQEQLGLLRERNDVLDEKFNQGIRDLQEDKARGQELLNKKPGLVGKMIQDSFNDLQSRLECATGDMSRC